MLNKTIDSGRGQVPILSVIAILAISLTVNLPGLAISPVLGELKDYFPHVTKLEIQLLNVLPNLVTIPFILCSGKICTPRNQLKVLSAGLIIFLGSGVGYFFARTMPVLIALSCLLGVGCGLVIPLAASLISQNFTGKARGTVLGTKSGLSNFAIIIATLFVGWVAAANWHYAFIVYFVPLIPLALVPFMRNKYIDKYRTPDEDAALTSGASSSDNSFHFQGAKAKRMMAAAMIIYFFATYATMAISYYLPFSMKDYGMDASQVGVATSMYYLSATIAGFGLSKVIKGLGVWTMQVGLILATAGLFCIGFLHSYAAYIVGIFVMGLGYGLVQPILYDKTSYFAPTNEKATAYFSYLLTFNYIGISSVPFIVEFFGTFIKGSSDPSFSYILNGTILSIVTLVCILKHRSFVVQAGVIPEDNGLIRVPSSVIAPGEREVAAEAPGHVEKSGEPAVENANDKNVPLTPSVNQTAASTPDTAEVIDKAEDSVENAEKSMEQMRGQQATMLRDEAAELRQKGSELDKDADELLDEANELSK